MAERWLYPNATLVRVVDGDSVVCELRRDVGFHCVVTFQQHLRLNRVNCPPKTTTTGILAKQATEQALSAGPFTVETVGAYKYGDSWMAEFTLPSGANLSDMLVASKLAQPWDGTGPRPGGLHD